jgi:hypothetical protein
MMILWLAILSCIRPSDVYDVSLSGAGTTLESIEPAPSAMGGRIELVRFQLQGTNLGHGLTGLYGDIPRADGTAFVVGEAHFGYPATTGFDRESPFLSRGPTALDACFVRTKLAGGQGFSEYVDVGDHIALSTPGSVQVRLERDPSAHPRPAGESWYVGYGNTLMPALTDHADLPDTWRPEASWNIGFPGTVAPAEATFGVVPFPLAEAVMHLPPTLDDLTIGGESVRSPRHGKDDVRFAGPWGAGMKIGWTPSSSEGAVTVAIRLHGAAEEGSCGCEADCGAGFTCKDGQCLGKDGSNSVVLGELVCTLEDDGAHTVQASDLKDLWTWVPRKDVAGATLWAARINEGTAFIPDVLTWNGKRVGINPIRVRASDIIVTRLEAP